MNVCGSLASSSILDACFSPLVGIKSESNQDRSQLWFSIPSHNHSSNKLSHPVLTVSPSSSPTFYQQCPSSSTLFDSITQQKWPTAKIRKMMANRVPPNPSSFFSGIQIPENFVVVQDLVGVRHQITSYSLLFAFANRRILILFVFDLYSENFNLLHNILPVFGGILGCNASHILSNY